MPHIANGLIKFEKYEIDRARWQLSWRDEPLQLNRKTFDLLLYLIDHRERVVGKEELLQALWPEQFIEESNLTQHIFLLRKALSRHESGAKIIETVPGRGYRFGVRVEEEQPIQSLLVIEARESITRVTIEEETDAPDAYSGPLLDTSLLPVPVAGRVRRSSFWLVGASITVSFLAVVLLLRQPRPRIVDAVRLTNDGIAKHLIGYTEGIVTDGTRLIFMEKQDNQSMLAEVPIAGGEVHSRPAPFPDAAIADYSSVNHTLLIGSTLRTDDERPILAEALPSSQPLQVGELTGHNASWSPDARSIAVTKGRFLYIADADGSNERRLVSASGVVYSPRWSPDGRVLSFSENVGSNENRLWEVDATGANLHRLLIGNANEDQVCCGTWSADGRNFFYVVHGLVSSSIWVLPRRQKYSFFQEPKPTQLTVGLSDLWQAPLPSADGRALWAVGSHLRGELMTVNATTRQLQPFLGGVSAEGVSFSPDRSWIVYTAYPEGTLWRSRPDGSEKRQLSKSPLVARFPQWSPDGCTIAFMASQPGSPWRIYLVPADGGKAYPILEESATEGVPNWSPDGKQISFGRLLDFGSERDPNLTIEFYDLDSHSHKTLHGSEGMWTPRWSPDGRFLSAVTQDNRTLRLYDMQTQQWTDLASVGVNDVIWSRDSRYLYFDTFFGGDPTLYRIPMDDRKLERWADLRGFPRGGFFGPWLGITPDGSPLLLKDTSIEEIYRLNLEISN
ncbi:winged helix-turn-helix domain-containing protein [Granulicella arctica]|uniref:Tol biopolymer transport system component/DNA-binding winged helix-turn-helix (WHTH) protein n=1 Tax=Granulicella arctica TaxID=940613 RepID=A0A7Y9TG66_9BACT|nr:winged helix-turn-helix domain-containing protein [Granulicella arctica]NYF79571.1 Tol biopolymer transport system component/DNA-binding winged helix-turn-helix (wHTH) protein [Granulicella arctica]